MMFVEYFFVEPILKDGLTNFKESIILLSIVWFSFFINQLFSIFAASIKE